MIWKYGIIIYNEVDDYFLRNFNATIDSVLINQDSINELINKNGGYVSDEPDISYYQNGSATIEFNSGTDIWKNLESYNISSLLRYELFISRDKELSRWDQFATSNDCINIIVRKDIGYAMNIKITKQLGKSRLNQMIHIIIIFYYEILKTEFLMQILILISMILIIQIYI